MVFFSRFKNQLIDIFENQASFTPTTLFNSIFDQIALSTPLVENTLTYSGSIPKGECDLSLIVLNNILNLGIEFEQSQNFRIDIYCSSDVDLQDDLLEIDNSDLTVQVTLHNLSVNVEVDNGIAQGLGVSDDFTFSLNTNLIFSYDGSELTFEFIDVEHQSDNDSEVSFHDDFYSFIDQYLAVNQKNSVPEFNFFNGVITLQVEDLSARLHGEDAGLYLDYCVLEFLSGNSFLPDLILKNSSITANGFSGLAELAYDDLFSLSYEGFGLELTHLSLEIKDNLIVTESLTTDAKLILPGFEILSMGEENQEQAGELSSFPLESESSNASINEESPGNAVTAQSEAADNALPIKLSLSDSGVAITLSSDIPPLNLGSFIVAIDDFSVALTHNNIVCAITGTIKLADTNSEVGVSLAISDSQSIFKLENALSLPFFEQSLLIDTGAMLVINAHGLDWKSSGFEATVNFEGLLSLSVDKQEKESSVTASLNSSVSTTIGDYIFSFNSCSVELDGDGIDWGTLIVDGSITGNSIDKNIRVFVQNETSWLGFHQDNIDQHSPSFSVANTFDIRLQTLGINLATAKPIESFIINGVASLKNAQACILSFSFSNGQSCIFLVEGFAQLELWEMDLKLYEGARLVIDGDNLNWNKSLFEAEVKFQGLGISLSLIKPIDGLVTAQLSTTEQKITVCGCKFVFSNFSVKVSDNGFIASSIEVEGSVTFNALSIDIGTFEYEEKNWLGGDFSEVELTKRSIELGNLLNIQINSLGIDVEASDPLRSFYLSGEVSTLFSNEDSNNIIFEFSYDNKSITHDEPISFELMGMKGALSKLMIDFDDDWQPSITELEGTICILDSSSKSIEATLQYSSESGVTFNSTVEQVIDLDALKVTVSNILISYNDGAWSLGLTAAIENHFNIPGIDDFIPSDIQLTNMLFGTNFQLEEVNVRWKGLSKGLVEKEFNSLKQNMGSIAYLDGLVYNKDKGDTTITVSVDFIGASFDLGPIKATIEGLGFSLKAGLLSSDELNNSLAHFSMGEYSLATSITGPSGLAVAIDAPAVSGSGYLYSKDGLHQGFLNIRLFDRIEINALGILSLRNNETSFIVIMSAEFRPAIPLGLNFYLSGLGGIIGYNRSMNTDKMLAGIKDGSVETILFPENPADNIAKIISNVSACFPEKQDQFLIGPMAKIEWNKPALLTLKMGVLIEAPDPLRMVILGIMSALLPKPDKPLITLNVAFLGIIDFDKEFLSFDAAIFDSKLLTYSLLGDMCLRLSWGKQKALVLSVGGFHPAYTVPVFLNVPKMQRMTLNLLSGNPKLTLTSYFAVTSNTVQFGAGVYFYFKKSKFKIVGDFGYDVLFQFDPFAFIAEVRARLALKWGSRTLMSLGLKFALAGPTPWNANGYAKFSIFWCSYKARFNKTWGEKHTILPEYVDVWPLFYAEFMRDANWEVVSVNDIDVTLTDALGDTTSLLQPDGLIKFNQEVLPLDYILDKYGNYRISDYSNIEVTEAVIGEISTDVDVAGFEVVNSDFAPAHFRNMKDEDKLSSAGFSSHCSGFIASTKQNVAYEKEDDATFNIEYELVIHGNSKNIKTSKTKAKSIEFCRDDTFARQAKRGAIFKSKKAKKRRNQRLNINNAVSLKEEGYKLVFADDHSAFEAIDIDILAKRSYKAMTFSLAQQRLREVENKLPALKGELLIVADNKEWVG